MPNSSTMPHATIVALEMVSSLCGQEGQSMLCISFPARVTFSIARRKAIGLGK